MNSGDLNITYTAGLWAWLFAILIAIAIVIWIGWLLLLGIAICFVVAVVQTWRHERRARRTP